MSPAFLGLVCAQGWEDALVGEVRALLPSSHPIRILAPGVVAVAEHPLLFRTELVFARQWLPDACEITAGSVKEAIAELGTVVDPILDADQRHWGCRFGTTDEFTFEGDACERVGSRSGLLQEKFFERMTTFRRRAMERFRPWTGEGKDAPPLRLQVLVLDANRLVVSLSPVRKSTTHGAVPVPWLSANERVPHDDMAPCRSYYKVEEAFALAGRGPRPGEVCVDLGAAPGGWSWAALKRGAKVIAVDFAELATHVERHPACEHRQDNGYASCRIVPAIGCFAT